MFEWFEWMWRTDRTKEGNVLFNDALNTFYLRLYGVRHMVKDHPDNERGNPLPPHRLLFPISSKGSFICTIPQTELMYTIYIYVYIKWNSNILNYTRVGMTLGVGGGWNLQIMATIGLPSNVSAQFLKLVPASAPRLVERSLMVRWVVGSILHGENPLSYFSFQPVLHDWCNKGRGMYYPVCGMVHIKEHLLLIDKSSLCGACLTPYNRR